MKDKKKSDREQQTTDPSNMEELLKAKKKKDRKDRWSDLLKKDHDIDRKKEDH